jgi:hypothetical protein
MSTESNRERFDPWTVVVWLLLAMAFAASGLLAFARGGEPGAVKGAKQPPAPTSKPFTQTKIKATDAPMRRSYMPVPVEMLKGKPAAVTFDIRAKPGSKLWMSSPRWEPGEENNTDDLPANSRWIDVQCLVPAGGEVQLAMRTLKHQDILVWVRWAAEKDGRWCWVQREYVAGRQDKVAVDLARGLP